MLNSKSLLTAICGLLIFATGCDNKKDQTASPDPVVTEQSLAKNLMDTTWCTLLCDPQVKECDNETDHITALFFNDDGTVQLQKHPLVDNRIQNQASQVGVGTWALSSNELSMTLFGELEKGPIAIETDKIGEKRLLLQNPDNPKDTQGELKECAAPKAAVNALQKADPNSEDEVVTPKVEAPNQSADQPLNPIGSI